MTERPVYTWLRNLGEKATPGPWFVERGGVYNETRGYLVVPTGDSEQDDHDAAFIAAVNPHRVGALLDRLADLRDALEHVVQDAREWEGDTFITAAALNHARATLNPCPDRPVRGNCDCL